jgi:MFS family permease
LSAGASALAPFRVRSFRYQWPADVATSWAFEMESLILGWYVLVETKSVLMLAVFAALQFTGTLVGPMVGVMGDRLGHRKLLCGMRATYATLATTLMVLTFAGVLTPVYVFVIAALTGLVRPSDIGMRATVVGETMPATQLMAAMGIQRTTQDTARIAGALTGAGLVAMLGMGPAYAVVAGLYTTSLMLTWHAGRVHGAPLATAAITPAPARASPWRELQDGLAYVRDTPLLLALMCLAFLLNLTAFPLMNGVMPYVVKDIYRADQTVLGYMVASTAFGALLGSLVLSRFGGVARAARLMLVACVIWYLMLLAFSRFHTPAAGMAVMLLAGFAQSLGQVPMATLLLRNSEPHMRGRVMGIRMLAINGNMPGLLISGPLIASYGYPAAAALYCAIGLVFTLFIALRWRAQLWRGDAPANKR